jgi:hypothetical protein
MGVQLVLMMSLKVQVTRRWTSIVVDEELQGIEGDEDEHITLASTSSLGHVHASTLEA